MTNDDYAKPSVMRIMDEIPIGTELSIQFTDGTVAVGYVKAVYTPSIGHERGLLLEAFSKFDTATGDRVDVSWNERRHPDVEQWLCLVMLDAVMNISWRMK